MKKHLLTLSAALLTLTLSFVACGGSKSDPDPDKVSKITVAPKTLALQPGGSSQRLTATVTPSTATNQTVTWTITNGTTFVSIAPSGKECSVTPVAEGSATITVSITDDGKTFSDTCTVTVSASNPPPVGEPNVYVAGFETGAQDNYVATLWKNGTPQRFNANVHATADSVFVSGTDVYLMVTTMDGDANIVYRNGEPYQTINGYFWHASLFVSGNDVYVATTLDTGETRPALYKNGVRQNLGGDENKHGHAYSVFVAGNDVFVAGESEGKSTLWKNGTPQRLSSSSEYSGAEVVFVSGSNVYVVGWEHVTDRPVLWKNNVPQQLESSVMMLSSIFVSGNDVYLVGGGGIDYGPTLWKNNVPQRLGGGEWLPTSVYVSGTDIYVTGDDDNNAILCKNGVVQYLNSPSNQSSARSVFVK